MLLCSNFMRLESDGVWGRKHKLMLSENTVGGLEWVMMNEAGQVPAKEWMVLGCASSQHFTYKASAAAKGIIHVGGRAVVATPLTLTLIEFAPPLGQEGY